MMKLVSSAVLLLGVGMLSSPADAYRGVTWEDMHNLYDQVWEIIEYAEEPDETAQFMIGMFIRLNFHDCVGGCDGCINLNNTENKGLDIPIRYLEEIYLDEEYKWYQVMSRADFWAAAGTMTLGIAADNVILREVNSKKEFIPLYSFYYGRVDCETAPYYDQHNHFPTANNDVDFVLDYFEEEFGFDERQAVTIMGAHTLGRARVKNTGFRGMWIENGKRGKDILDNRFYKDISDPKFQWVQEAIGKREPNINWQWRYGNQTMRDQNMTGLMLDVDMSLFLDISPVREDGKVNCTWEECPLSHTSDIVDEFAENNTLWMIEFGEVWEMLLQHGYEPGCMVEINSESTDTEYRATCWEDTPVYEVVTGLQELVNSVWSSMSEMVAAISEYLSGSP